MTTFRTISQVAEYLSVHPKTVRAWIDQGKLKAIRVGRLYRVPESALADFTQGPLAHEPGLRREDNEDRNERANGFAHKAERLAILLDDAATLAEQLRDEALEESRVAV